MLRDARRPPRRKINLNTGRVPGPVRSRPSDRGSEDISTRQEGRVVGREEGVIEGRSYAQTDGRTDAEIQGWRDGDTNGGIGGKGML